MAKPPSVSWSRWTHLENVGQVPEVEDVMESDCCGEERGGDLLVEGKGQTDQLGDAFLQWCREVPKLQVLSQDGAVDGGQGICSREGEGKHAEVTLDRGAQARGGGHELDIHGHRTEITSSRFG